MKVQRISDVRLWSVQALLVAAVATSLAFGSATIRSQALNEMGYPTKPTSVTVPRTSPLVVTPLYDDPEVVSDDDLAAVLAKIQPRFAPNKRKPNHVEHALRTWHLDAKFRNPRAISGEEMKEFLVDHGKYLASWKGDREPLLQDQPDGVSIRWGGTTDADGEVSSSVHHDHWLACLTEAGIGLKEPVLTPTRRSDVNTVLQEALRDFRIDEVEVEWSAMAFGLWIAPQRSWTTRSGREVSFDMLVDRLMRGHRRFGTCAGTHRLYSLMLLIRLDDDHDILSDEVRALAMEHLAGARDLIMKCQFDDGHWPSNWNEGASALERPVDDPLFKKVIATGHHLEWLAIAPQELHPPREMILKASRWLVSTTKSQSESEILRLYTYFSHVGNALSLWRKTHPSAFWMNWESKHPNAGDDEPKAQANSDAVNPESNEKPVAPNEDAH